ncbi:MAG: hypothetical protein AAGF73_15005 [Actinomycetota bacterium]
MLAQRTDGSPAPSDRLVDRLARDRSYRRLDVESLDEVAVNAILTRQLHNRPSRALLADVLEITEGNPLFVLALVGSLERLDALVVRNGEVTAVGDILPEHFDLDRALHDTTASLSAEARRVIEVAALLGDRHPTTLLQSVVDIGDNEFETLMDELEGSGVLIERPDNTIQFRHTLVRQVATRAMGRRRRQALHARIGAHLIDDAKRSETADELRIAHHLRRAGPRVRAGDVIHYSALAANRSAELAAWGTAARYAKLAIERLDAEHTDDENGPDLLELTTLAARADFHNHDPASTAHYSSRSIEMARARGDHELWGEALLIGLRSELTLGTRERPHAELHLPIEEYLSYVDDADQTRARCWQLLSEIAASQGRLAAAEEASRHAVNLAEQLDDDELRSWAFAGRAIAHFTALRPLDAIDALHAAIEAAQQSGNRWIESALHGRLSLSHLLLGQLDEADAAADRALDVGRATHHWAERSLGSAAKALVALSRADLHECAQRCEDALLLHERSASPFGAGLAAPQAAMVGAVRLDRAAVDTALDRWRRTGVGGASRFQVLVDTLMDPVDVFIESFDADRYRPANGSLHALTTISVTLDAEVAFRRGDRELARSALMLLTEVAERGVTLLLPVGASVGRLRALCLATLGERDPAVDLLTATELTLRVAGCIAEAARCAADRSAIQAGARDVDAVTLTELVQKTTDELDSLELIGPLFRLSERLPDHLQHEANFERTVVAWDMVSSTPMLVSGGDAAYVELVRELNEMVELRIEARRGRVFKYTGDGLFAWFHTAADACACARAVRRDLEARNQHAERPFFLRVGISTGRPIDDGGDLFGVAVVTAARLCDAADSGQILSDAASAIDEQIPGTGHDVGDHALKGLPQPVAVVELLG